MFRCLEVFEFFEDVVSVGYKRNRFKWVSRLSCLKKRNGIQGDLGGIKYIAFYILSIMVCCLYHSLTSI